ncbi:MAG: SUMF1/EgtB/PvdO family nonheme iron enzyme [Bacteroidales bacterium]|nr:SUMF1/EgtB/PvdO family nonheme iron enzyme [Bacteroidales bacterium]
MVRKKSLMLIIAGIIIATVFFAGMKKVYVVTSTDKYCMSCHVHTESDMSWIWSTHTSNNGGVKVHCAECHLPPKDKVVKYTLHKAKHGFKDLYGFWFKDTADLDFPARSNHEAAAHFVYKESCLKCHTNLFPVTLSDEGSDSHLRYEMDAENKRCISCHISVGHYDPLAHASNIGFGSESAGDTIYPEAARVKAFEEFTETIPGTSVSFKMKAVPGGNFAMGSKRGMHFIQADEIPAREVKLDSFWLAEIEVTWDEYLAFFAATGSQGRKEGSNDADNVEVDAISGPTPPWGAPDQGWGKGSRPAITMTHHAATVYCQWLSKMTGKSYRLPTEAEWEYAARGGAEGTYFFEAEPEKYVREGFLRKIFGADTSVINSYIIYAENSSLKTQSPDIVKANPFGLKNMLGNVAEFCYDFYDPAVYQKYPAGVIANPFGPRTGEEHAIRGGAFNNSAKDVRIASRDHTRTIEWLVTDPQIPKSIWWYSDCKSVGFRVLCEYSAGR